MAKLIEWIIPHSGGEDQALSICYPHSLQPAQLDEDTSLHGVPTPDDTPRTLATSTDMLGIGWTRGVKAVSYTHLRAHET